MSGKKLTVTLTNQMHKDIRNMANKHGLPMTAIVKMACANFVESSNDTDSEYKGSNAGFRRDSDD